MFWMAADVGGHERAERYDPKSALARIIQRAGDQRRAEAPPLE